MFDHVVLVRLAAVKLAHDIKPSARAKLDQHARIGLLGRHAIRATTGPSMTISPCTFADTTRSYRLEGPGARLRRINLRRRAWRRRSVRQAGGAGDGHACVASSSDDTANGGRAITVATMASCR